MTLSRARSRSDPLLAATLAVVVAANLLNNWLLPSAAYVPTCVASAVLLLLLARRDGCSWTDLGLARDTWERGLRWAGVAAALVFGVYTVAALLPGTRQAFVDERAADPSVALLLWNALARVPLGTVLLEEVAFRGVLYAMLARRFGVRAAILGSSALFGLWHILPSIGIQDRNAALASGPGSGEPVAAVVSVLAAVLFTGAAGVLFCELRRRSGSLLAPSGLHWALNGLGFGFAWAVTRF